MPRPYSMWIITRNTRLQCDSASRIVRIYPYDVAPCGYYRRWRTHEQPAWLQRSGSHTHKKGNSKQSSMPGNLEAPHFAAYAQEIAADAPAPAGKRHWMYRLIVDGAVGMVEMALVLPRTILSPLMMSARRRWCPTFGGLAATGRRRSSTARIN